MLSGVTAVLTALVYVCALFAVAHFADTSGRRFVTGPARPIIYALAMATYCTSWTFFGSVGLASTHGWDFLPTYISPIIVIGLLYPFVIRIADLARSQNIVSVADFVAARYGKSGKVAALVAVIAVIGVVPYIALQLKAISQSVATVLDALDGAHAGADAHAASSVSVGVAVVLAGFAIAFGTRRIETAEHQDGLMAAVATESLVKLAAFLVVGLFVVWGMFDGPDDLIARAAQSPGAMAALRTPPDLSYWVVNIALAASCILLLPRQFHVTIVENRDAQDIRLAARVFPLYLIAINLFVIPIAIAGHVFLPVEGVDRDMTVLALPLHAGAPAIAIFAMIGGISAATAMVIVESVALSIMISNDLVMPLLLRGAPSGPIARRPGSVILLVRRLAILLMLWLGYLYLRTSSDAGLVSIGLLSFAAITQIAPAFLGGVFWRRANARGALGGLAIGMGAWAYTLMLPTLVPGSALLGAIAQDGPFGVAWLRPEALFGLNLPPLVHGVLVESGANICAYVFLSLTRAASPLERIQADIFAGGDGVGDARAAIWRASISAGELEDAVALYLGAAQTRLSFDAHLQSRGIARTPGLQADVHLFRFAERQLASAIGAASSRLALSLLLRRRTLSRDAAFRLIDDASAALQQNRDLLQRALDFARQGVTVMDRDMRIICWNREFRDLFELPPERLGIGVGMDEIVRFNIDRGFYGPGDAQQILDARFRALVDVSGPSRLRLRHSGEVIEIRSARMPDGGIVTTYADITATVRAEEALAATNETLEQRVRERTEELTRLNAELGRAKQNADDANLSKTRFLAAASHDILQPLNAARLFTTALSERIETLPQAATEVGIARNLNASLEAVEDILGALLEISRLDGGAMKTEIAAFRVDDVLGQLRSEFEPAARDKGLEIKFVPSSLTVRSDRRLLRRMLQNLVANAIKYTNGGKILVGCRHRAQSVEIQVVDTGIGIPDEARTHIFREFERLPNAARIAPGIGLGLSIVERIGRVLDHRVLLRSTPGRGSLFAIVAPMAPPAAAEIAAAQASAASRATFAGLCVVAIDNDARILDGMEKMLSGWGCTIVTALDLSSARAKLSAARASPDVVIADYHLDEGTGLEVIAALRAEFGAATPAVLVTADQTPELRDKVAALGAHLLLKPLKPAALRALLSQWRQRAAAE